MKSTEMPIWPQLIWKEWREQVWKAIALTTIALSVEGYFLIDNAKEELHIGWGVLCAVPGAFFIAMSVAAGERTAGSLDFVRSLPFARWKWAVVRLVMGAVAALIPVVAATAMVFTVAWLGPPPLHTMALGQQTGLATLFCLSMPNSPAHLRGHPGNGAPLRRLGHGRVPARSTVRAVAQPRPDLSHMCQAAVELQRAR